MYHQASGEERRATAYKRLYGKEYQGEVLQLFEQLWFNEPSRAGAKLEPG